MWWTLQVSWGGRGGVICVWNPKVINISIFIYSVRIWLQGRVLGWDCPINLFNCYVPYLMRELFWDKEGLFKLENVILTC